MTPAAVERLADAFWERAGVRPPPPRDVEPVVALACPVFVDPAHPVTPAAVRDRCRGWGLSLPAPPASAADRRLFGCVVAHRGRAVVVVDRTLPADERRVVVAHEVGHYLAEYLAPRERAARRLGPAVLPVLDGDRGPTAAEVWAAALAGVRLGAHAHALGPGAGAGERTADALALELLAPARVVRADVGGDGSAGWFADRLVRHYGLPPRWAGGYARRLAATAARTRPPSRRWKL